MKVILKGLEIFDSMVFTQIRPVGVGDLVTWPKILNFYGLGHLVLFSAVADFAKKNLPIKRKI